METRLQFLGPYPPMLTGEKRMSNQEEARRARADQLRKKIAEHNALSDSDTVEDHPEMLPNETPNEYVERRNRELKKKKK
jgi:hypothetical protein